MSSTPPRERIVWMFALAFAKHWGLEAEPLYRSLIVQLKRLAPAGVGGDEAALEALLAMPAMEYRNSWFRPILKDLFDWLRAGLSYRYGRVCHAIRDDAVSQTVALLLDYWKPWWSRPEGQEHLRRYAMLAAGHAVGRILRGEKARESRLPPWDDDQLQADPATQLLQEAERRQSALIWFRLRDLDWLLQAGLTQVEAKAVVRFLTLDPTDGLDQRAEAAWRKALQRAKERLQTIAGKLKEEGLSEPSWCRVDYLGLHDCFHVIEYWEGGLWLEGPVDRAELEVGADCLVRIYLNSTVIVRGANCVRIDRVEGRVRIALKFLFQPRPPADTRPTL